MVSDPELSVVVPTGHTCQCAELLGELAAEAAEVPIELIVVHQYGDELPADRLEPFVAARFVRMPTLDSAARARAAGVRTATAPAVVFAENHCFPQPGWARALLGGLAEGWDVTAPQFAAAHPGTAAEAMLICDYPEWIAPAARGEAAHLPGHNSCYRRELLLELGDELEQLLESETVLQWELRERGGKLLLESRAGVIHRNYQRPKEVLAEESRVGTMFASVRSRKWSRMRRLLAAALTPLLPLLFTWRLIRTAAALGRRELLLRHLPLVLLLATSRALGEARGYLTGIGESPARLSRYEFHNRPGIPATPPPDPARL